MNSFFERFFGGRSSGSKEEAKSRLKMVLMHDQVDLTPAQMEAM
jgi:septum formation topological specificity factor MinE